MKKFLLLTLIVLSFLVITTGPVIAQGGPGSVYVDPSRTDANEDGTQNHPYNTTKEAIAYAQSLPNGGYVYIKNQDGTWGSQYVAPVVSGGTGIPFSDVTIYALLAIFAVGLILVGWKLQRHAHSLRD